MPIAMPCIWRSRTGPAAQPLPPKKSTFYDVSARPAIMQWNALPKTLQREIFDTAGSVGTLLETAALRGQIARFLHKRKDVAGRNKALTEDARHNARSGAAALSRWDNEGGAVRDGLPM